MMTASCTFIVMSQIISARGLESLEGKLPGTMIPAQWAVQALDQPPCLILSGNFSFIFVHEHQNENPEFMDEEMRRLHFRLEVPNEAEANGHCGDQRTEINLSWRDPVKNLNLLNLVITKNGRLAGLTGVFARLHQQERKHELTSHIDPRQKEALSWPFRYCVSCERSLYYPLYRVDDRAVIHQRLGDQPDRQEEPVTFIVIENLMMEAFRDETKAESMFPELYRKNMGKFYRREWQCEFHHILSWAPPVVGGTLLVLLGTMAVSFLFKSCLGCSDYQRQRGYQKI